MQTELIESRTGKKFLIKNFGGYVVNVNSFWVLPQFI